MTRGGAAMPEVGHHIDLDLLRKLREDPGYRQQFFLAESSAEIAEQLIALRKRRGRTQAQVADATGTKQPAISRAEQADYQNHNLNTLRSIAQTLDARVRVLIQPYEDVLVEYESDEDAFLTTNAQTTSDLSGAWQPVDALSLLMQPQWAYQQPIGLTGLGWGLHTPFYNNALHYIQTALPERHQEEISALKEELINKQRMIDSLTRQVTSLMLNLSQETPKTLLEADTLPELKAFRFQDQHLS
jgi:transcriptional regulator with XRE-family HTH domain